MTSRELAELDRRYVWHPHTQHGAWLSDEAPIIESASGCTLTDVDGIEYIDGSSSLACNIHGHGHPAVDAAVRDQLERVACSTLHGASHEPAIRLAQRLVEITPEPLTRVFYSDNGSTAVETALKIAVQHQRQSGSPRRNRFLTMAGADHGATIGALSLGGIDRLQAPWQSLLFSSLQVSAGDSVALERTFAEHGSELAAVVVEPLVQVSAGVVVHPTGWLRTLRQLCDEHGVLLVLDEVATGFGRTGTMFACRQESVEPDMLCLAHGLTGGHLPLAATLTTEQIHQSFLGDPDGDRTFLHGHTQSGSPLACAAALASLDVFEQEQTLDHVADLCVLLGELLEPVSRQLRVREVRRRGLIAGIELADFPAEARAGHQVTLAARRRGVILRPLDETIVLMPPLAIGADQLRRLVELTAAAIDEVVERAELRVEKVTKRRRRVLI